MVTRWTRSDGVQVSFSLLHIYLQCPLTQLQNSGVDAGIKLRPTNEELASMSPEFSDRWSTFFANAPDKPVVVALPFAGCVHLIVINPHFELILNIFLLALVGRLCLKDSTSVWHTFLFVFFFHSISYAHSKY